MGKLYDATQKIEACIKQKNLDAFALKGKIGLKSGILMALISPDTPDDNAKIEKLRAAVKEILGIDI